MHRKSKQNLAFNNILFIFFQKPRRLWDYVEKYCKAWQAADGNMARRGEDAVGTSSD
jgi:hypothetical protein